MRYQELTQEFILECMREKVQQTGNPTCYLDFEFNNAQELHPNLVCGSFTHMDTEYNIVEFDIWLLGEPTEHLKLKEWIEHWKTINTTFVGYATSAEARCISALGIDPMSLTWVDLYAEWKQLTYNNNDSQYGTIFNKGGYKQFSTPPSFDSSKNGGKCVTEVGGGMADAIAQMFGVNIDKKHKDEMRDLILENRRTYTAEEKNNIMGYCRSDITYLPAMWCEMTRRLEKALKQPFAKIYEWQKGRGEYISAISKMETRGYPVRVDWCKALRHNFVEAEEVIISTLVHDHWPFYVKEKKSKSDLKGRWVNKYSNFIQFLELNHPELRDAWPRTVNKDTKQPTDKLSREEKVLNRYTHIPEIASYAESAKMVRQLTAFKDHKDKDKGDIFEAIGSDNRLRTFLGAYGTQTARNAPKASRFILAMASWLRCLIQPLEGRAIIGIDYSSQEFLIAAVLSKDPEMMKAYKSGDPYLYFAKASGAVPKDAESAWCKNPVGVLEHHLPGLDHDWYHMDDETKAWVMEHKPHVWLEFTQYQRYTDSRDLFKSTTLGLQYGMGVVKLAEKLTADTGKVVTIQEATTLRDSHKRLYRVMWAWTEKIWNEYQYKGYHTLQNGWSILKDCTNQLSFKNAPTQGTGSVIMQRAVILAEKAGVEILSPLHDALYAEVDVDEVEEQADTLKECMLQAVEDVLGDRFGMRCDVDIHTSSDIWVEGKGKKWYGKLKKYLEPLETAEDREKVLIDRVMGNRLFAHIN